MSPIFNEPSKNYLIICHISKINNIKQLVKIAIAFNCIPVLVGLNSLVDEVRSQFNDFGRSEMLTFEKLLEAKEYLSERGVKIIGIEILEEALPLQSFIFPPTFALMPGNEGTGLNEKQKSMSDLFVYIPQYGCGTASLNVHVATTLVLHQHYMTTLGLP